MPLGWERINIKRTPPNKNIVFIKPVVGPDEATSKDYLERIAAQCLPIMNKHHLAVVSLEEYEPNLEFWGRNFNNGEVIQLVLKSPSTGRWLPFKFVQMVMMHELAHNKQMNHSKAFWKVRNEFSEEMRALWNRAYTGEGLWGRGVLLENGAFAQEELGQSEILPEHMCGGTFRSRSGKKRKAKPKITYKEAKERRIRRKFGVNGVTLGADDEVKVKLENGKRPAGKPRVAGSARGRELRAAAALARFDVKTEDEIKGEEPHEEDLVTDSEVESDLEEEVTIKTEPNDAVDIDGRKLLDSNGGGIVKVCEDDDKDNEDAKREILELQGMQWRGSSSPKHELNPVTTPPLRTDNASQNELPEDENLTSLIGDESPAASKTHTASSVKNLSTQTSPPTRAAVPCPVCSVENNATALTCSVCSNVLQPDFVIGSWTCKSSICEESNYINAGDVGMCGICGSRRGSSSSKASTDIR